ncbi:proton-conducting transporter membrane subunit [Alphaproteobacteria bacterium]|jgi:multicomponent Na+:H+ antiporter subunit D|nr:proton-conducting transporter membrane subunit [Alphaproteobacteria bacterium]
MITADNAIILGLAVPLIVAILTPIFATRPDIRDCLGPIGGVISLYAAILVARAVIGGETPEWFIISISEGLNFSFKVTPLGAIFGLVASGLWIMAAIYSVGYMRGNKETHQTRFNAFYAVAVHAALAIAWSGNLLVLFIFYEVLTFSTYPLVIHKQTAEAMRAGRLYMGILVGTSLMLLLPGVIWVWTATGSLDFVPGGILAGKIDPAYVPWMLALFAFGIGKSALMPIHRWLPAAMVAPTPVSALLHAVAVVKAGVFTMLMVVVYIFGYDFLAMTGGSVWLIWLASFTILASSVIAIQKDDIKARLAYSTISQLSYIVLGAALANELAAKGAALHIVMHASAKITLFFCAGAIYVSAHIKNVSQLNGLGYRMPLVFVAFFLGALSIIGIPPLGGSWSKFFLMAGAAENGMIMVIIVLAVSSLMNVYYLLEPVLRGFYLPEKSPVHVEKLPLVVIPPVITAVLCVVLFFVPGPFLSLINLMVMP